MHAFASKCIQCVFLGTWMQKNTYICTCIHQGRTLADNWGDTSRQPPWLDGITLQMAMPDKDSSPFANIIFWELFIRKNLGIIFTNLLFKWVEASGELWNKILKQLSKFYSQHLEKYWKASFLSFWATEVGLNQFFEKI